MIIGRSRTSLNSSGTLPGVRRREIVHSGEDNSRLDVQNVDGDSSAIGQTLRTREHDSRALRQPLRGLGTPRPLHQDSAFVVSQA